MKKTNTLLIGAGPIGTEYVKSLIVNGINFEVYTRSEETAEKLLLTTGKKAITGRQGLLDLKRYESVIICTPAETLFHLTKKCLDAGVQKILLEKPGLLNSTECKLLEKDYGQQIDKVLVAYNRRFYPSVEKLDKLTNGGSDILSIHGDFTELYHNILESNRFSTNVLQHWGIANSSHVLDLVQYFAGNFQQLKRNNQGSLRPHFGAAYMSAIGITDKEVQVSLRADWRSAGRWGLWVYTHDAVYILQPLEKLFKMKKGEFSVEEIEITDVTQSIKLGIHGVCTAFVSEAEDKRLIPLKDQIKHILAYEFITGIGKEDVYNAV